MRLAFRTAGAAVFAAAIAMSVAPNAGAAVTTMSAAPTAVSSHHPNCEPDDDDYDWGWCHRHKCPDRGWWDEGRWHYCNFDWDFYHPRGGHHD